MKAQRVNYFGKFTRVQPESEKLDFAGVRLHQGAQILRIPRESLIMDLELNGGASHLSRWATLRGAVVKFDPDRADSVILNGKNMTVPSAHTLMDRGAFEFTRASRNSGKYIPHRRYMGISQLEDYYLVHASYCHPDQLFLPQGRFTETRFYPNDLRPVEHMSLSRPYGRLYLVERELDTTRPFNVLSRFDPQPLTVFVQLAEGGHIRLTNPQN
jgi:hypothetical protein